MLKSFNKILAACTLSLLLVGCAQQATVLQAPAPPKVSKPKTLTAWSVDLPEGWSKDEVHKDPSKVGEVARVLLASKEFNADGVDYEIRLNVIVGRITPDQVSGFSAGMVEAADSRDNAKVLEAREYDFGGVAGHEWVEVRQLDSRTLLGLIGAAGAKGDLAAIAVCGGNAAAAEEYMEECMKVVESLRFN